ncbi:MAG: pyridoxine 5'-phosphate synthase [Balneolaceae bacterium]
MQLLVNIDHIATLRNARGEGYPDPVAAARICEEAGAAGIVFHLRGDRRHIRDQDVSRLKKNLRGIMDFEMAATDEMIKICSDVQPHLATLVPESREELTTEGGLMMKPDICEDFKKRVLPALHEKGIEISLFLDPNPEDIEQAAHLGVEAVELHTGTYSNAASDKAKKYELERLREGAELIHSNGMQVNAGHGLNLENLPALVETVPHLHDISIGHALVSDALFMGLENTVKQYLKVIKGEL